MIAMEGVGRTPDEEFRKIAKHINANGGTAYTSKEAASAQIKMKDNLPC